MRKILVIDDSKTIRTLCEWIYKGLEDKVYTAATASDAETIINAQSPDIIFVDYTLEGDDAIQFIRKHAAAGRKVVLLGGTYAPCDADGARAAGAADVIIKPFKSDDFFELVERVISGASAAPAAVSEPAAAPVPTSGSVPSIASFKSSTSNSGVSPFESPSKRFNFPGSSNSSLNYAPGVNSSSQPAISAQSGDQATPTSPVPSISAATLATQAGASEANSNVNADIEAAVKALLPEIASEYLKKSIRSEMSTYFTETIMPQLQKWVDARVVAIVRKMMQK